MAVQKIDGGACGLMWWSARNLTFPSIVFIYYSDAACLFSARVLWCLVQSVQRAQPWRMCYTHLTAIVKWRKVRITSSPYGFYGKGYTCDIMLITMRQYYANNVQSLNISPVRIRDWNRLYEVRLVSNRIVERSGEF